MVQLELACTSVLLSNYLASVSFNWAGKLGPVFGRVAVLPLAGPRVDRLGECGALPAAQMESEIWGHRWGCQLGDWLSKPLSGHLMCQALLAGCCSSPCPPLLEVFLAMLILSMSIVFGWQVSGYKVQGAGLTWTFRG